MSSIVQNTLNRLKLKVNRDTKKWISEFNKLSNKEKYRVLSDFEKLQAIYIKDSMGELKNPIKLHFLGQFYYKQARKDFYELKDQNLDREEILKEVKIRYQNRKNKSKKKYVELDINK